MEWLRQIAPLVGTALGGPLGGAVLNYYFGSSKASDDRSFLRISGDSADRKK